MTLLRCKHFLIAGLILSSASLHADTVTPGCETIGAMQGLCGFPAPEDIDVMPDGKHLLLSAYGGFSGEHPQLLRLFNTRTLSVEPLHYEAASSAERWGDSRCQTAPPAELGSHGIDISQRSDGRWQLLAVNHSRESIEFFEIINRQPVPVLAWRGCVIGPAKSSFNDVAALKNGGFLVTHMFDRGSMELMAAMSATSNTGFVQRWQPGKGFDKLPGSDAIIPNGIVLSADQNTVFVSETAGQRVRKIDYSSGKTLGSITTGPADNLSWAADGRLISTAITGPTPDDCFSTPGPCLTPFNVLAINTNTMQAEVIHQQAGPPMGMSSVALLHGKHLYIGSFKGQQMLRVTLPESSQ